jgi:cysteine-rich repeat protein
MTLVACGDDEETNIPSNLPKCPNGEVDAEEGEECDDGNRNNRDECSNDCVEASCHDGIRQEGEECDDDNNSDTDDCVAECEAATCGDGFVQAGVELCDDGPDGSEECGGPMDRRPCAPTTCGDGEVQPGEECDDGNLNESDGCTSACTTGSCGNGIVEEGEECDDGNQVDDDGCTGSSPDAPASPCSGPFCGDAIVQQGEACDDGNDVDDDTCPNNCAPPNCGDGIVQADEGEECDDGNAEENDSCLTTCLWNSCQDGHRYLEQNDPANTNPLEECDDGNDDQEDECLQDCTVAVCGDGFVARKSATGEVGPEQCDDGEKPADAAGDECTNDPRSYNDVVPCYCSDECTINQCGNGVIDPGEECDDGDDPLTGNGDNNSCTNRCEWNECGDGLAYINETNTNNPNSLEDCDDANDNNNDACVVADFDSDGNLDCKWNTCGDSFLYTQGYDEVYDDSEDGLDCEGDDNTPCTEHDNNEGSCACDNPFPTEACDDGNDSDQDSCIRIPHGGDASEQCTSGDDDRLWYECALNFCGDGEPYLTDTSPADGSWVNEEPIEECDDANHVNNDSCIDDCSWNDCHDGWWYTNATDEAHPTYGTGSDNGIEDCDDGNMSDTDDCVGECEIPFCGDGFTHAGVEGCDDANGNTTDGCGLTTGNCNEQALADGACLCQLPGCGDGNVNGEEDCDEGTGFTDEETDTQLDDNDSCLHTCLYNGCGDGWRYMSVTDDTNPSPLEQCDDGNGQEHDTCTQACDWNVCGDGSALSIVPTNDCNGDDTAGLDPTECTVDDGNIDELNEDCARLSTNACDIDADHSNSDIDIITCDTEDADTGLDDDNDGLIDEAGQDECLSQDISCFTDSELDDCFHPFADQSSVLEDHGGLFFGTFGTEECDDGNLENTDDCVVENEEVDSNECSIAFCGDGYVQEGEQCDTGEGDCEFVGETLFCGGRCNGFDTDLCEPDRCQRPYCGDGIVQMEWTEPPMDLLGETCDPEAEPWETEGGCGADCIVDTCGNGTVDEFEECDDGDDTNTDDCTNGCIRPRCGDGIVTPVGENLTDDGQDDQLDSDDEQCDDGNEDPTDSCTNDCKWNVCGDGVRYLTVSDDGNPNDVEQCDSSWYRRDNDGAETFQGPDDGISSVGTIDGSYGNWDSGEVDFDGVEDFTRFGINGVPRNDDWTDGPGLCSSNCELQCFPNQGVGDVDDPDRLGAGDRDWAGEWKDGTYCLFAAEPYGDDTPNVFDNVTLPWEAAQEYCEDYGVGANLAAIVDVGDEDANEVVNDFGTQADANERNPNDGDFIGGPDEWWWVGLHDNHTSEADPPGEWAWWPDGPNVSENNGHWAAEGEDGTAQDQPDDADGDAATPGQQDCGYIKADDGNDDDDAFSWATVLDGTPATETTDDDPPDVVNPNDCLANENTTGLDDDDSCGEDGDWYDLSCSKVLRFFCEFALDQSP